MPLTPSDSKRPQLNPEDALPENRTPPAQTPATPLPPAVANQAAVAQAALQQVASTPVPTQVPAAAEPKQPIAARVLIPVPAPPPAIEQPQSTLQVPVFFNPQIYGETVAQLKAMLPSVRVCEALRKLFSKEIKVAFLGSSPAQREAAIALLKLQRSDQPTLKRKAEEMPEGSIEQLRHFLLSSETAPILRHFLGVQDPSFDQPQVLQPELLYRFSSQLTCTLFLFQQRCNKVLNKLLKAGCPSAIDDPAVRLIQLMCIDAWMTQVPSKTLVCDILFHSSPEMKFLLGKALELRKNYMNAIEKTLQSLEQGNIQINDKNRELVQAIQAGEVKLSRDTIERDLHVLYGSLAAARYLHHLEYCYCAEHACTGKKDCAMLELLFNGLGRGNPQPVVRSILIATYDSDDPDVILRIRMEARIISAQEKSGQK